MPFKKLYVFKKSAYISYPCKVKHFIYDSQQIPNNKFFSSLFVAFYRKIFLLFFLMLFLTNAYAKIITF